MRYTIKEIQQRLNTLGYSAGPVDGVRGKKTIAAIKAFQLRNSLRADGIAGSETLEEMFGHDVNPQSPDNWPWLTEMMRVYGYHEVYDNEALSHWLKGGGKYLGDPKLLPWCGDAVETAILRSLPNEPVPTAPFWARSWKDFGIHTEPRVGAILVFGRGPRSGHVGFYVGETKTHFVVLGGNQENRIKRSLIRKDRLIASRWPRTVIVPASNTRLVVKGDSITETRNEE